jgi:hypothetical protein
VVATMEDKEETGKWVGNRGGEVGDENEDGEEW